MRIRTDLDKIRSLIITEPGESDHYGEMMKNFYRTEKARFALPDYTGIKPAEWTRRRRAILRRLTKALGPFPKRKVPLNPHTTRITDRGDYTVEALYFHTRPNWPVSACFYLPKTTPKRLPAILLVHGHSYAQKAAPVYQKVAIDYVKHGYAVLAVDFVGGGDRTPQQHVSRSIFTAGATTMAIMVWDNMRAVDYLASRREVDQKRIGITGSSGGGNQTAFTTVFDERIAASAPVNAVSMLDEHMAIGADDFCPCEIIPSIWTFAEYSDLMATVAPRPLLLVQAIKDRLFPIKGTREVYYRAREVYKALGAPGNIDVAEDYGPHHYASVSRAAVMRWFDRHLRGVQPKPFEDYENFITCEDERSEVLQAFPGGRLPRGTLTLPELSDEMAKKLPPLKPPKTKKAFAAYRKKIRAHLTGLAGKPETLSLDREVFPEVNSSWATFRPFVFRSERGILIPSVLIEPKDGKPSHVVIHAHPEGKSFTVGMRAVKEIVTAGAAVLGLDLRGTGETAGAVPSELSPPEGFLLNRSIMLGRHISMQRAWDIMKAVDAVRTFPGYARLSVRLWGEGPAATWALYAFALDDRIKRLVTSDLLLTLRSKTGFAQTDSVLTPNMLLAADVPDIIAASIQRKILVARGQLPSGAAVGAKKAADLLAAASECAALVGSAPPEIELGAFEKTRQAVQSFLTA